MMSRFVLRLRKPPKQCGVPFPFTIYQAGASGALLSHLFAAEGIKKQYEDGVREALYYRTSRPAP